MSALQWFEDERVTSAAGKVWLVSGTYRHAKAAGRGLLNLTTVHGDINDRAGLLEAVSAFVAARYGADPTSGRVARERRL